MGYMFDHLKNPKNNYTMARGVTDFAKLEQWNLYETGYSILVVCQIPKFLEELGKVNSNYKALIDNYVHILEYEFRGITGLDNMEVDTNTITDGINELNVITKVNWQSATNITMNYFEKAGSVLTRVHELFLRGIKDPRTQVKHYHGLIRGISYTDSNGAQQVATLEAGYENEVFSFLYYVTDNTMKNIEKAYFLACAQPTTAELSIYESEKGSIEFKEVGCQFNCFPITGTAVNKKASEHLDWLFSADNVNRITVDSTEFAYSTKLDTIVTSKQS